jgi:hypothetical protein
VTERTDLPICTQVAAQNVATGRRAKPGAAPTERHICARVALRTERRFWRFGLALPVQSLCAPPSIPGPGCVVSFSPRVSSGSRHHLAKVRVAGSSLVVRSTIPSHWPGLPGPRRAGICCWSTCHSQGKRSERFQQSRASLVDVRSCAFTFPTVLCNTGVVGLGHRRARASCPATRHAKTRKTQCRRGGRHGAARLDRRKTRTRTSV